MEQNPGVRRNSEHTGDRCYRCAHCLAKEHPEAVADFMEAYQASVSYVTENTDEAAKLIGDYDIVPEAVAKKALPACNIVCITGDEMKEKLSGYLGVLKDQNPEAVGGELPGDDFYYSE